MKIALKFVTEMRNYIRIWISPAHINFRVLEFSVYAVYAKSCVKTDCLKTRFYFAAACTDYRRIKLCTREVTRVDHNSVDYNSLTRFRLKGLDWHLFHVIGVHLCRDWGTPVSCFVPLDENNILISAHE